MKLTYGLVQELLGREFAFSGLKESFANNNVEEIALYPGRNINESILYVTDDSTVRGDNILLVTENDADQWKITVSKDEYIMTISRILSWYHHFMEWQNRCIIFAEAEHDLGTLLEECTNFLETRWMVVDRGYRYVEVRPAWPEWEEEIKKNVEEIPKDVIESMYYADPQFDDTFQQKGICVYPQEIFTKDTLYYYNIFQETFYLGRVLINVPERIKIRYGLQVLEFLCQLVEDCYQYNKIHKNRHRGSDRVSELFRRLLNRENIPEEEAESVLSEIGWKKDQNYEILCLVSHGYAHSEETLEYYARQLEEQFPSGITLRVGEQIFCIHNLSLEKDKKFRQKLSGYIRENLFKVGVSNSFYDISKVAAYGKQAETALDMGRENRTNLWRYDFADYVSEYTMRKCMEDYPARELCPGNLRKILDYDAAHEGSQLTETLYHYYTCNFNAQKAAERLFVHRTTFFYRMSKIQKIAAFHIEDPEETCQVFLALLALKYERTRRRL